MADHLRVDLPTLQRTADALGAVSGALRTTDDPAGRDRDVLGHPALVGAMEDFTGNWRIHREQLISSVDAHEKMVRAAVQGHQELDRGLAQSIAPDSPQQPAPTGVPK
jgi:hypothetical protein